MLQHWAINSSTTTGHNLPQSHLPTKQDAYIISWLVPAAKTRAQSASATCSLLHTKHTSLSHQIVCYSLVHGQMEINNDGYWPLSSEISAVVTLHKLVSLPRKKWSSLLAYSGPWPWSAWEYLWETTLGAKAIYVHVRAARVTATIKLNNQSSWELSVSGGQVIPRSNILTWKEQTMHAVILHEQKR